LRQIVQNPRTGRIELLEVPDPAVGPGQLLVRNCFSVVSPGTEKTALEFARKSLLEKARNRPDLVRQVLRKLRSEGPLATYRTVTSRLDAPQPLGYSSAGIVEAVGEATSGFSPGNRVACAGAGYANHAELVVVPENLAAHVPEGLALEKAAFATLGAIALQALRVAEPTLGEICAVIGLGVIGQLTVQLLVANGCRVLAIDLDPQRAKQALDLGAEWSLPPDADASGWISGATGGAGADLAIVTAASDDSTPLQVAAELCRLRGRVIAVGATAMDLDRRSFYAKELQLRMSTSYGPGRYDRGYEELGLDYPLAYVRWTENRNLQAFLALAARGSLDPMRLDAQVVPFEDALAVYEDLASGRHRSLVAVFRYPETVAAPMRELVLEPRRTRRTEEVSVAFIGAGNYARSVLLPNVAASDRVRAACLVTATGPSARRSAERFGFERCGTDPALALGSDVDLVFIATTHDAHARLATEALRAGKAVWLEKPPALDGEELENLLAAARETGGFLAIGYNRRFSRHARWLRERFADRSSPLALNYVVSAGPPPTGTWYTDPRVGGGRILGESCHFVDLCTYLVGHPPVSVYARALGRDPSSDDSFVAALAFGDGSAGTLSYLARADRALPKERIELSAGGVTAFCDDFRRSWQAGRRAAPGIAQDKGQQAAVREVVEAVRQGRPSPFSLQEIGSTSRTTFGIVESLRTGRAVELR
jgi:predicted dehydrogenase/threonine dehydrogenase-like Zn-dependent dehydrogenase